VRPISVQYVTKPSQQLFPLSRLILRKITVSQLVI